MFKLSVGCSLKFHRKSFGIFKQSQQTKIFPIHEIEIQYDVNVKCEICEYFGNFLFKFARHVRVI